MILLKIYLKYIIYIILLKIYLKCTLEIKHKILITLSSILTGVVIQIAFNSTFVVHSTDHPLTLNKSPVSDMSAKSCTPMNIIIGWSNLADIHERIKTM